MLSIGKLGTGQEMYYLEKVAEGAEDYYSGEGEVAGQWMGDAAAELGLSGEVGADQLTAMLTANNPAERSAAGPAGRGRSRPGPRLRSDLLGSEVRLAPLGPRRPCRGRRGQRRPPLCGRRRPRLPPTGGVLDPPGSRRSASSSKATATSPPPSSTAPRATATPSSTRTSSSPTRPRGRTASWTRLYHPAIYEHAQTASYLYQAELRHELTRRLGVEWQEVRKGIAEIEGFADDHLREFSTRRAEILEAVGADASARSMEVAALTTRQAKEQNVSREELHERWQVKGRGDRARRRDDLADLRRQCSCSTALAPDPMPFPTSRSARRSPPMPPTSSAAMRSRQSPAASRPARRRRRSCGWPMSSSPPIRCSASRRPYVPSASPPAASGSWSARRSPPPSGCRARPEGRPGS